MHHSELVSMRAHSWQHDHSHRAASGSLINATSFVLRSHGAPVRVGPIAKEGTLEAEAAEQSRPPAADKRQPSVKCSTICVVLVRSGSTSQLSSKWIGALAKRFERGRASATH